MKNKQNNKYGFTLVELLAVIVILAIILVIAVPKVMSVIEDSKKATLESTAKMIASSAEKAKVQNTVLGKEEEITCDSVAKINSLDYESCSIEFDNNTAKVTITGKGKFEGLYVCGGTKTEATATSEECGGSGNNENSAANYIAGLLADEETLHNGLFVDDTKDKNIRYHGENPNNKVYFNCKDTYNEKSYGSEGYDYANACETWRIIGIFDVKTNISDTQGAKRIKIVRDAFTDFDEEVLHMSWDSSASNINDGFGINEWSESDLKCLLNEYYLGTTNTCAYCASKSVETCSANCKYDISPLSTTSQNMISKAVWSTRGIESKSYTAKEVYEAEQTSELTAKECRATNNTGNENSSCNDTIERKMEWEGKIGLIYPSDWGYASSDEYCDDINDDEGRCYQSNWLYSLNLVYGYWTILPEAYSYGSSSVWYVSNLAIGAFAFNSLGVRPSLYLHQDVQIIGGNGDTEPYKLSM